MREIVHIQVHPLTLLPLKRSPSGCTTFADANKGLAVCRLASAVTRYCLATLQASLHHTCLVSDVEHLVCWLYWLPNPLLTLLCVT